MLNNLINELLSSIENFINTLEISDEQRSNLRFLHSTKKSIVKDNLKVC